MLLQADEGGDPRVRGHDNDDGRRSRVHAGAAGHAREFLDVTGARRRGPDQADRQRDAERDRAPDPAGRGPGHGGRAGRGERLGLLPERLHGHARSAAVPRADHALELGLRGQGQLGEPVRRQRVRVQSVRHWHVQRRLGQPARGEQPADRGRLVGEAALRQRPPGRLRAHFGLLELDLAHCRQQLTRCLRPFDCNFGYR